MDNPQLTEQELACLIANDNALRAWRHTFRTQLRQALTLLNGHKNPGPDNTELLNLLRALLQATVLFLDVTIPHNPGE